MHRSHLFFLLFVLTLMSPWNVDGQDLSIINDVAAQPLISATERLVEALKFIGAPLSAADSQELDSAMTQEDEATAVREIQRVLDAYCLTAVDINPESRVKVAEGPAEKILVQQGWRTFLVKVHNEAGTTPVLKVESPHALPIYMRGKGARERPQTAEKLVTTAEGRQRFLDLDLYAKQPLKPTLSGLTLEYRIIQLFSRDSGPREAEISFNVGQGTQDIGFRNAVPILFDCQPAVDVSLGIMDFDGTATTAALLIQDKLGRVYPNPARRLAPDFFFHNQIYRTDGETVTLSPGEYTVTVSRGPEYVEQTKTITVAEEGRHYEDFRLQRWVHPAVRGWYSGDHHIHAAGCSHYDSPTEGVGPPDMMRHILGEDLNVGCVLTWGPCWYSQKKFFTGGLSDLSQANYLMRYDVEVSGFPSSHAGHLCLLRLTEDDYPNTTVIEEWPSWTLPILKWGKEQGAVVGYSHSGWGLALPDYDANGNRIDVMDEAESGRAADTLPDYAMPLFDGIGANEYIVAVAHELCDFISAVDTPAIWELNIWYHTLNCGMRTRISGETDFPCIYGDKVGLGRIYVKLPADQALTYNDWIFGVRDGRSYCGDGRSHVLDFCINDVDVGQADDHGSTSQLNLDKPGKVRVEFDVAALLAANSNPETESLRTRRLDKKPYWHIERCRIEGTRRVSVEVVVNGYPVVRQDIEADGSTQSLGFDIDIQRSSWVAVRILPSVHTNPIFVEVENKPIRASRRSAQWCRDAVDVCWKAKKSNFRPEEIRTAQAAYDKAREIYDEIIAVSFEH